MFWNQLLICHMCQTEKKQRVSFMLKNKSTFCYQINPVYDVWYDWQHPLLLVEKNLERGWRVGVLGSFRVGWPTGLWGPGLNALIWQLLISSMFWSWSWLWQNTLSKFWWLWSTWRRKPCASTLKARSISAQCFEKVHQPVAGLNRSLRIFLFLKSIFFRWFTKHAIQSYILQLTRYRKPCASTLKSRSNSARCWSCFGKVHRPVGSGRVESLTKEIFLVFFFF